MLNLFGWITTPNLISNFSLLFLQCRFFSFFFIIDYPETPYLDILFAINTAGRDAVKTFEMLRNALKNIIQMYDPDRVRYGVIIYGDSASLVVRFSKDPQEVKKLTRDIDELSQPSGLPNLEGLLQEAKKVFEQDSGRPKANKVLVVVTDAKSSSTSDNIKQAAKPLEEDGVTVVAVTVGDEANNKQLEKMIPDKQTPLSIDKEGEPNEIGEKIMEKVLEGGCNSLIHKVYLQTYSLN